MKRFVVAGLLATGTATGVYAQRSPIEQSRPPLPSAAELERLNLHQEWKLKLPIVSDRDGIATAQHFGDLIVVQMLNGTVYVVNADANADERLNVGRAVWQAQPGEPFPIIPPVAVTKRYVIVTRAQRVTLYDRATGGKVQDYELPITPSSPITADDDLFIVGMGQGRVVAYNLPLNTEPKPTAEPKAITPSSPAAGGGSAAPARRPTAKARTQGPRPDILWDYQINQILPTQPIDPRRGSARRFKEQYNPTFRLEESPVIGKSTVFLVNASGAIVVSHRLSPVKDIPYPFHRQLPTPPAAAPAQYGDTAYVATTDGIVYAFDFARPDAQLRESGRFLASGRPTHPPVVTDDDVFLTTSRAGLYRLTRVGLTPRWENPEVERVLAANPKFVYAADKQGNLLVLDRTIGTTLTTWNTREYVELVTNPSNDRLILAAHDGTIVSLRDRDYRTAVPLATPGGTPAPPLAKPATRPDDTPTPEMKPSDMVEPGKKAEGEKP